MADGPQVTELISRAERGGGEAADRLFEMMSPSCAGWLVRGFAPADGTRCSIRYAVHPDGPSGSLGFGA